MCREGHHCKRDLGLDGSRAVSISPMSSSPFSFCPNIFLAPLENQRAVYTPTEHQGENWEEKQTNQDKNVGCFGGR